MAAKLQKKRTIASWDDSFYVKSYRFAHSGLSNNQIAENLGISPSRFTSWIKSKPALKEALDDARTAVVSEKNQETFKDYVYGRLSPRLQQLWDKIDACENLPNGIERVEQLFSREGTDRTRQYLFLYALIHCNFNRSKACQKVNISSTKLKQWEEDPDFAEIVSSVLTTRKDVFEEALVKKVIEGDSACVIFANKTLNRDRGYADQLDVKVKGKVEHDHSHEHKLNINLEELDLTVEVMKAVLDAIEKREKELAGEKPLPNGIKELIPVGLPVPVANGVVNEIVK
jgi:hypothetical protein